MLRLKRILVAAQSLIQHGQDPEKRVRLFSEHWHGTYNAVCCDASLDFQPAMGAFWRPFGLGISTVFGFGLGILDCQVFGFGILSLGI